GLRIEPRVERLAAVSQQRQHLRMPGRLRGGDDGSCRERRGRNDRAVQLAAFARLFFRLLFVSGDVGEEFGFGFLLLLGVVLRSWKRSAGRRRSRSPGSVVGSSGLIVGI